MHAVSKYFLLLASCFTNLLSIIITDRWRSYRIKACHAECEVFPSSPPQLRFFLVFFCVQTDGRQRVWPPVHALGHAQITKRVNISRTALPIS